MPLNRRILRLRALSGETCGRALGGVSRPAPIGRATLRRSRRCGFRIPKTVALENYRPTSSCGPAERVVFGESALVARQEPRPADRHLVLPNTGKVAVAQFGLVK